MQSLLGHPLTTAVAVAFFCGALAYTATLIRQARVQRGGGPGPGSAPLRAGLMAMAGALAGIALARWLTA